MPRTVLTLSRKADERKPLYDGSLDCVLDKATLDTMCQLDDDATIPG
jgi:hypothetical protein